MALVPYAGFVGGAYRARSPNFDSEECVNLYPEAAQANAKNVAVLYGCPGKRIWVTLGDGPIRGVLRISQSWSYVVSGVNVYRVAPDKSYTVMAGVIPAGVDLVSMASNGVGVVIAAGGLLYSVDTAALTVTQIVDADFLGAGQIGFISGYYVWNVPGTGQSQYSQLYSTTILPLSFFTAEGNPDAGVGVIVDHLEYWYFGESTTEVYSVVGDADAPLQRISGAFIEHGCISSDTIAKMDNTIYWLGQDDNGTGTVWRATGAYEPQRVSTHAIEYAIAQTGDLTDSSAFTYQQEGHAFYVLTVGDVTYAFDASTSLWHRRAALLNGELHKDRARCCMNFGGVTLVGDYQNGNLYELSLDIFDDNGAELLSRRTGPYVSARTYNMLQVDFETGVGLQLGNGSNPQAMLQWSDDGGHTWSQEHWADIGAVGEYQNRVRWRRLGSPRKYGLSRCFRVTVTDPVRRVITGAMLDASA